MGRLGCSSAINISHIYWNGSNWEFRIFGWIHNKENIYGVNREKIMNFLKKKLNDSEFWRDIFNVGPIKKSNGNEYLIEYPDNNWNFVDFGKLDATEKEKVFKEMVVIYDG